MCTLASAGHTGHGAYGHSMANNYNSTPGPRCCSFVMAPPGWWCGETHEDLVQCDVG